MPLRLWDIGDSEAFVHGIAAHSGLQLSHHDFEELEQYLLVEIWQLSLRYQPGIIRKGFGCWATTALRYRVIDWQRQRFGRRTWRFSDHVYERPRVELVSLDDAAVRRLDEAQSARAGDPEDDGDSVLAGVLGGGDRARARDYELLGLEEDRRAAR